MENFVYIILAVAYVIYYVIKAANKNPKTKPPQQQQNPRPAQSRPQAAPVTPDRSRNVFDILREEIENRDSSAPPPTTETMDHDPFEERRKKRAEEMRVERENRYAADHFSEERLVREYKRTHAQGKTIEHHTHDYFDPKTDKVKSRRKQDRDKKHPITLLLRQKNSIRNAIILKEVLDRKH